MQQFSYKNDINLFGGLAVSTSSLSKCSRSNISQNLTWAVHCIATEDLVLVYCSLIRSVVEYACAAFANLPCYLANALEKVQRHALARILPGISYKLALSPTGLTTLEERRAALCTRFIQRVDKTSPLYSLIRDQHCQTTCQYNRRAVVPKIRRCNTDRFKQFVTVKYGHHLMCN